MRIISNQDNQNGLTNLQVENQPVVTHNSNQQTDSSLNQIAAKPAGSDQRASMRTAEASIRASLIANQVKSGASSLSGILNNLDRWMVSSPQSGFSATAAATAPAPTSAHGTATPNSAIKDFQTTNSTININDDLSVSGLTVAVNINHSYAGDLVVKLKSPDGKEVVLRDQTGGRGNGTVNFTANPADFVGVNSKGTWTLSVADKAAQDQGTLKSWSLDIAGNGKTPNPTPTGGFGDDANFKQLPTKDQNTILKALADNPGNQSVATEFKSLIDDSRFSRLSGSDKTIAINAMAQNPGALANDLLGFAGTSSYRGFNSTQKMQGQQIVALLSSDSALNPSHNPMERNTVNLLATGNVLMGLPSKAELKKEGFTDQDLQGLYGFAYDNIMNFNVYKPGLLQNKEDLVRTAAHEINHVINDRNDSKEGVLESALDEYRAWYVENFAVGIQQPTVAYMQDVFANFFSPRASYTDLRDLYNSDPQFKAVADKIKTDLDRGVVTDPEQFRTMLAALIGKDKNIVDPTYLTTPANLDNHI